MSRLFVATNEGTSGDSVFLYDVSPQGALTLISSNRIQASGSAISTAQLGGRVSADGRFAFVSHQEIDPGDFGFTVFDLENDLAQIAQASGLDGMNSHSDVAVSSDASVVWGSHFSNWTGVRTFDGAAFGAYNKIREGENAVGCTSDGMLCVAGDNASLVLLENDGGSPVLVDSYTPHGTIRNRNIAVSPDDQFVAVRSDTTVGKVEIYALSETGLTLLDDGTVDDGDQYVRPHWSADGTKLFMADRWFSWDGTTLTQEATFAGQNWVTRTTSGSLIANVDASSFLSIKDGATFAELSSKAFGESVSWFEFLPSLGPTTNEELFQASYADASAALPKITALIRPADVQRSIDTDVSNLKDGPNFYTVEAIFDLGELSNLNPYNSTTEKPRVFYVKDDQPGLRDGKNLLLKGYQIRSADPSVPVTCTFWGY